MQARFLENWPKVPSIIPALEEAIRASKWAAKSSVSGTVFDMRNAVYNDKPLIFIGATF